MKLIKIVGKISDNFNTPLVERVTEFFPRDLESTMENEYIIVSDSKFRLLEFNHVRMHVYKEFSETVAHNLEKFLKDDYYVIKEVIKPSEFDETSFDPSDYDEGDILFFYAEGPVKPEEPKKPKFHEGSFNYELTPEKKKELMDEYEEALEDYNTALEDYNAALKTFMENEGDLPIFGCLGVIINEIMIGKKLEILWDVSFETTKNEAQFGVLGKLPKEVPTKVGAKLGGLAKDTSIKGKSISEIFTKVFGLEPEEEVVGTIQPNSNAKGMSAPKTDYGEGKTSLGGPTDTATITTTLDADSEATNVKLVNAKTGETVTTKSVSDPETPVSFEVTGLTETTSYKIEAYHTEDEEEVIDGSSKVTVRVKVVPATVKLTAAPTTVATLSDEVVFTATVTAGSSAITSVKLVEDVEGATGVSMIVDPEDETKYIKTISNISKNTAYFVVVTDANGEVESSKVTITSTYVLPKLSNMTATPATITTATDITITATATKGTSDIAKVTLFSGDTVVKTITSGFDNISEVIDDVNETTTFKMVIEDSEGAIGNTTTATVTLNS